MTTTQQKLMAQRRPVFKKLFELPDVYASALLVMLVDQYDFEFLDWQPETIALQLHNDFGITLPQSNLDKIMAAISIATTDRFWSDLPSFIHVCNVLDGSLFHPGVFAPATVDSLAWGLTEALMIDPPEGDKLEDILSDEIRYYIGHVLNESGISQPPDILKVALYEDEFRKDPAGDFSGDTMMYEAIQGAIIEKNSDLQDVLEEKKIQLRQLLKRIPLKQGKYDPAETSQESSNSW
jgi:hypothetical protein